MMPVGPSHADEGRRSPRPLTRSVDHRSMLDDRSGGRSRCISTTQSVGWHGEQHQDVCTRRRVAADEFRGDELRLRVATESIQDDDAVC